MNIIEYICSIFFSIRIKRKYKYFNPAEYNVKEDESLGIHTMDFPTMWGEWYYDKISEDSYQLFNPSKEMVGTFSDLEGIREFVCQQFFIQEDMKTDCANTSSVV